MKQEFCVGICPCCDGNGNLLVVRNRRNHDNLTIYCDECEREWSHPKFSDNNILPFSYTTQQDYASGGGVEDATLADIEKKGWLEYIYFWDEKKQKWIKYTDHSKVLF